MRRNRRIIAASLAGVLALAFSGCQSGFGGSQPKVARSSDSTLSMPGESSSGFVAEKTPPSSSPVVSTVVDRHPLFSKPREIYDKSGNNTAVKLAGATLVGVPLGVYGELKQIVVGTPQPRSY
jgi:hypothetical protein